MMYVLKKNVFLLFLTTLFAAENLCASSSRLSANKELINMEEENKKSATVSTYRERVKERAKAKELANKKKDEDIESNLRNETMRLSRDYFDKQDTQCEFLSHTYSINNQFGERKRVIPESIY